MTAVFGRHLRQNAGVPVLTVVAAGAALLLVPAGAFKLVSPAATATAAAEVGRRLPTSAVRVLGAVEILVGVVAATAGVPAAWAATAALYAGFAGFVVAARRAGAASCGCFGAAGAGVPPSRRHVMVNVAAAAAATGAALARADGLAHAGWPATVGAAALAAAAYAVLTVAPRVRLASDRPTLVAFLSPTCLTCREWHDGLAQVPDGVAVLVVERRDHPAWARFAPAGTPTGVLVAPDGSVVAEAAGVPWAEARERLLAPATAARRASGPSSRRP
jgi:hypothetical protein